MPLPAHTPEADPPAAGGRVIALCQPAGADAKPDDGTQRSVRQDEERARALERVCAGFRTTISPRSAARLADLMGATTARAVGRAA
ncbi:hypothetical protein [Kitasatospora azatica]|uniref:hypothetical protein n=1 Tax=Kitasatospora azatica TaxID=58347 RepID=UPI00056047FF|nr:hypothetical protein [Kitasatospora azatica]